MTSSKTTLQNRLALHAQHIELASAFTEKFGDLIPEYVGTFYLGIYEKARFAVSLCPSNRERILSLIGDALGRDGWTGKLAVHQYNWRKEIDGIVVEIEGAESLPESDRDFAVPASKFPLQLAEQAA